MEYLTIKQFAEIANVTQQAIYKQLNSKLKSYVKIENGKKMISKSALKFFHNNFQQDSSIIYLEQEIEFLKEQIRKKDLQILELSNNIRNIASKNDMLIAANLHQSHRILTLTDRQDTTIFTITKKSFLEKLKFMFK